MPASRLILAFVFFSLVVLVTPFSYADDRTLTLPDSRYLSLKVGPTLNQFDLLESIIDVQVPDHIESVGAALNYVLSPYGFRLEDSGEEVADQYQLLVWPLPQPHRLLSAISLRDALDILGGESFEVSVNPVKRTVRYRLRPGFQQYITEADIEAAWRTWLEQGAEREAKRPQHSSHNRLLTSRGYGPVLPGENLSSILIDLDLAGMTADQALTHVFLANPEAFANGNMNHLYAGARLSVPLFAPELVMPALEASRLVDEHHRRWLKGRVQP